MVMGVTSFKQIRDINGYVGNTTGGLPVSVINQCFTLTATDITTGTAPLSGADGYAVVITVTQGADVFFLPAATPTVAVPGGTVTDVLYQLINHEFITSMVPGQAFQFLYENSNVADQTVTVHLAYYGLSVNSFLG